MSILRSLGTVVLGLGVSLAHAQETDEHGPLPQPLTLEYALSLAGEPHPSLAGAGARVNIARAQLEQSRSQQRPQLNLDGRLRVVEPADDVPANRDSHADHLLSLKLRQRLYDFGGSDADIASAKARAEGNEQRFQLVGAQRRLDILQAYFDVVLADLSFERENEDMAIAFIRFDRAQERSKLGQVSEVELLRIEADYQRVRATRFQAELEQRSTRERLAIALGRPGDLPSDVAIPKLPKRSLESIELNQLVDEAVQSNVELAALRAEREAASERVNALKVAGKGTLDFEAELSQYARDYGSREPARLGLYLNIPLGTGGRLDAELAEARARFHETSARLAETELLARQQISDVWILLQSLQFDQQAIEAQERFREIDLDRSRTLYEMEVQADLGDAMVQISEVRLRRYEVLFNIALAWARLDVLRGRTALQELDQ